MCAWLTSERQRIGQVRRALAEGKAGHKKELYPLNSKAVDNPKSIQSTKA